METDKNVSEAILCDCGHILCTVRIDALYDENFPDDNETVYLSFILHNKSFWGRLKWLFKPSRSQEVSTTRGKLKTIVNKL